MNGPMPDLPYDNTYDWQGEVPQPRMGPEETRSFEIGLSYQSVVGTSAWQDMLDTLTASAASAEADWLSVKPGEPYEKRIETLILWQQRSLLRRIVEQRALEMIQYSETAIREGISHGNHSGSTHTASAAVSSGAGSARPEPGATEPAFYVDAYGTIHDSESACTAANSRYAAAAVPVARPRRRKRTNNAANGRGIQGKSS